MARVIAIANQKGGVGKTTTAVNLAASLAVAEQRTLLIDGDPQGNATSGAGLTKPDLDLTIYDVLIGDTSLRDATIRSVQFTHLDVAPATPDLAGAEVELVTRPNRDQAMRSALEATRDEYDYVLIDCPPSLGLITINMLAAADALLIPLQCEYYALEGISHLLNTVHLVQRSMNASLTIDGVLLTMYDPRLNLSRQVAADAREFFAGRVFETVIPRNVRLAEAPSFGKPIILYDLASVGAQAYINLARELLERHQRQSADPKSDTPAVLPLVSTQDFTLASADHSDTGVVTGINNAPDSSEIPTDIPGPHLSSVEPTAAGDPNESHPESVGKTFSSPSDLPAPADESSIADNIGTNSTPAINSDTQHDHGETSAPR